MRKVLLTCAAALLGTSASAAVVGFSVNFQGGGSSGYSTNVPKITLTNLSSSATLTGFSLNIGNSYHNFDFARDFVLNGVGGYTLVGLDGVEQALRRDDIELTFSSFSAGGSVSFQTDIDPDSYDALRDYRYIVLPRGSATATFNVNGKSETVSIFFNESNFVSSGYTYSNVLDSVDPAPVPLPASALMLSAAVAALGAARRKA